MRDKQSLERECWLRLGTMAEKDYVLKAGARFTGIVINANLIEGCPAATPALVVASANKGIPYWIDPYTYPFAENVRFVMSQGGDGSAVKRTFLRLAQKYGPPISTRLEQRERLVPEDLADDGVVNGLCESVLGYQLTRLASEFEKDEEMKAFVGSMPMPTFVVAPYFFMGHKRRWRQVNARLALAFSELADSENLRALVPICFAQELLDDRSSLKQIVDSWSAIECSGYAIWISDLVERNVSLERLKALKEMCGGLSDGGKVVINTHGGYLSALLHEAGMTGFSHGVGYGEHRDVVPVLGGGPPPAQFYFPPLHRMLHPLQVETFFDPLGVHTATDFHEKICGCTICRGRS